ncbi:hypothetical protein DMB92_00445 [Campylobacter sp. MIT 99-7217]|uniref:cyclophilin-like fold protein n=1 Tax=Campylobacter sp. MIT 99-7217 TaxID=535091 RepID=UPI00115B9AF6|nr:cyclophilin-like fold protein [Campylobacter sp. MIT 99-7217]TQR34468.1 hypothetical protein DMB92_00445 [Campylobacter sp. MIT 99-7217]
MKKILFLGLFMALMSFYLEAKNLDKGEKMIISLSFKTEAGNAEKIVLELEQNAAAKSLYAKLPLELEFSDYVGKEKISKPLKSPLDMSGIRGYDPSVGDFFYFSPWGNLGIFYEKQGFHSGLAFLGKLKSEDLAKIRAFKNDFKITINKE